MGFQTRLPWTCVPALRTKTTLIRDVRDHSLMWSAKSGNGNLFQKLNQFKLECLLLLFDQYFLSVLVLCNVEAQCPLLSFHFIIIFFLLKFRNFCQLEMPKQSQGHRNVFLLAFTFFVCSFVFLVFLAILVTLISVPFYQL